jgi:hypothetical protein
LNKRFSTSRLVLGRVLLYRRHLLNTLLLQAAVVVVLCVVPAVMHLAQAAAQVAIVVV